MATGTSKSEIVFVTRESTYATAVAAGNGDYLLTKSLAMQNQSPLLNPPEKVISSGQTIGISGRRSATWDLSCLVRPSGTAGTPPDLQYLIESVLGAAATVSAGVSVTFPTGPSNLSMNLWRYRDPSGLTQQVAIGAIANSMSLRCQDGYIDASFGGSARWILDTDNLASTATAGKGGLSSIAARPSAPVSSGEPLTSFIGSLTMDGVAYGSARDLTLTVDAARAIDNTTIFNGAFGGEPYAGLKQVTFEVTITDDDTAALKALKAKCAAGTTWALALVVGGTAGSIMTINLARIRTDAINFDDSAPTWGCKMRGQTYLSAASASDEMTIVFT